MHLASHHHPSLSLGKAQCYVVFNFAHVLLICPSTFYEWVLFMALVFFLFVPFLKWRFGLGFQVHTKPWTSIASIDSSCKIYWTNTRGNITNLKHGFCCPFFLYANGRMVLGLFSIDFVYHVLFVCCILVWFKAKITCNKR